MLSAGRPYRQLFLICLAALLFRVALLPMIHNPGMNDPIHYYNLGRRLASGQGFTIDYVWQYNRVPQSIIHPIDHWMPLTGAIVALGMSLFGVNLGAALLPFLLLSILLPLLVYAAARQMKLGQRASLFAAAFAITLPEFVANSLQTDTTLPGMVLVSSCILALTYGLEKNKWWAFAASGLLGGLAYLNRNESVLLLPMLAVVLLVYWRWGPHHWRYVVLMPVVAGLVVTPWLVRNKEELGIYAPAELSRMFFFTDPRDHYAYQRDFTLDTLLQAQTPGQIIGKRLFELAAAFKQMYTDLDVVLPVAVAGGLLLLIAARDRERLRAISPTLILLLGFLVAYPLLIPYKSQSGSFKKAYLELVPMLLPLGAYAIERAIADRRIQFGLVVLTVALMGANAFELMRANTSFADTYYTWVKRMVDTAESLPDVTGDGEIRLMTQDPYILSYYGVKSVMTPMESREKILEVAARYGIDYLMMPADRPALDPLYRGQETDPRFTLAAVIADPNIYIELYALHPEGD